MISFLFKYLAVLLHLVPIVCHLLLTSESEHCTSNSNLSWLTQISHKNIWIVCMSRVTYGQIFIMFLQHHLHLLFLYDHFNHRFSFSQYLLSSIFRHTLVFCYNMTSDNQMTVHYLGIENNRTCEYDSWKIIINIILSWSSELGLYSFAQVYQYTHMLIIITFLVYI